MTSVCKTIQVSSVQSTRGFQSNTIFRTYFELHICICLVSHSHTNGNHPGNPPIHVFNLPWTHLWKLVSYTYFNNCKFPLCEKWLALWSPFLSIKKPISSKFATQIIFVPKNKKEFWWWCFTPVSKTKTTPVFFLLFQGLCLFV